MEKMKLDLDDLKVESFDASSRGAVGVGTVQARETGALCVDGNQSWDGGCGGDANLSFGTIGCQNSAFPCQSVNACNTDACGFSLRYPNTCGAVSYPDCSLKCTNIIDCTTPDMSCVAGC